MPGGRVTREAFETFRDEILAGIDAAMPVAVVLVNLHGAMALEDLDDAEWLLLTAIRSAVGPDVPIVAPRDAIEEPMSASECAVHVLADISDSGASGTAGDGTVVLRALLDMGARSAAVAQIMDAEAVAAGDKDSALTAGRDAARKIDKAASKGVIHKNQAANRKSGLAKQVAGL